MRRPWHRFCLVGGAFGAADSNCDAAVLTPGSDAEARLATLVGRLTPGDWLSLVVDELDEVLEGRDGGRIWLPLFPEFWTRALGLSGADPVRFEMAEGGVEHECTGGGRGATPETLLHRCLAEHSRGLESYWDRWEALANGGQSQCRKRYEFPALGDPPKRPDRETAGAFLRRGSRYLVARRPQNKATYPGQWDTPGGHVEVDEHPDETLIRELGEELGIRVHRYHLLTALEDREAGSRYRHHIYVVTQWTGEIDEVAESDEERWLTVEEILNLPGLNPVTAAAARALRLYSSELEESGER